MKTFEYICTVVAIAGVFFVFTLWQPDQYTPLLAQPSTQMVCPDPVIKHSVKSDLTTGIDVRDACAESLNVFKY